MIYILHYLKDPKLWELLYILDYGVMQDLYHQPQLILRGIGSLGAVSSTFKF